LLIAAKPLLEEPEFEFELELRPELLLLPDLEPPLPEFEPESEERPPP
jgi:hypothetical protein